jgi:hypothetical protein
MKKLSLLGFSIFLFLAGLAQGNTYFISPDGNDANNGLSPATAWKTISRVNSFDFGPGDRILFEGGKTFSGTLMLQPEDGGTAATPLVINSYGVGKAIIDAAGMGSGLYARNVGGVEVRNLVVVNSGLPNIDQNGIDFYMDQTTDYLEHVVLDGLEISGFGGRGIFLWTGETDKGFKDVRITHCVAHDNGMAGIETMGNWDDNWQSSLFNHTNIYVAYCKAYANRGVATYTWNHSGSGIFVGGADGALIEYSEAYENGSHNGNPYAGPIGIWMAEVKNGIIQFCESHHNQGGAGPDGGGFDLDGGAQNCIIQYCYSHDNTGAGFALFEWGSLNPFTNNIIRYNISQNDGRARGYAGLAFWGVDDNHKVKNCEVYNNTIYSSTTDVINGTPAAVKFIGNSMEGVKVRNNVFYVADGVKMLDASSAFSTAVAHFQNNTYYTAGGSSLFAYGGSNFTTLNQWKAAAPGQEMSGAESLGITADPLFVNPGGGGIVRPSEGGDLASLTAYRLQFGSRMIDAAINLKEKGLDIGSRDFFNNSLAAAAAYDIGANEFNPSSFSVLPLRITAFDASIKDDLLVVAWQATNCNSVGSFSIEISRDGNSFQTIKTYGVKDTASFLAYNDKLTGEYPDLFYCRIKAVEKSGRAYYSPTKKLQKEDKNVALKVYPNPVVRNLTIEAVPVQNFEQLIIWRNNGTVALRKRIETPVISLDLQGLAPGVYYLEFIGKNMNRKIVPIIKG